MFIELESSVGRTPLGVRCLLPSRHFSSNIRRIWAWFSSMLLSKYRAPKGVPGLFVVRDL